jgi:hypothetical protein
MNTDDFEKRLQHQPLRHIPDAWRSEILRNAPAAHSSFVIRHSLLSSILWPHPKAWAALGCVWILIFALHGASRGSSPMLAEVPAPKSANVIMTLKDREQTLVELIGANPASDVDQPRKLNPQPRSERRAATAMA